jgi:holo-[acyl-carrier protein] synthase
MIIGIGSDLTNIERIEKTLGKYGERFVRRVFTPAERAKAASRTETIRAATYAKRFAAKEACAKALGTGIYRGVFFRDMGVVNLSSGQPTLELSGGALEKLRALTPPGMKAHIHLSLTDDHPWAQAFVVIEALPA